MSEYFEVDQHDYDQLIKMVHNLYRLLRNDEYINRQNDWELRVDPLPHGPFQYPDRIDAYVDSITRGDIFPPIVVDINGAMLDGRHKAEAFRRLGKEEAPCAISVKSDSGGGTIIKDEIYLPLIEGFEHDEKIEEKVFCLECGQRMHPTKDRKLKCECGRAIVNAPGSPWTVINGDIT